jgi:hypothetical protein
VNFRVSTILTLFLCLLAVPVSAKEIIMNCGSREYPWVYKYVDGWFGDKVYERVKATWVEACTKGTIDILSEVTSVTSALLYLHSDKHQGLCVLALSKT